MRAIRLKRSADRDFLGGFADGDAVGGDEAGGNGVLRLGAAFEQAAFDEQQIRALARGHGLRSCSGTRILSQTGEGTQLMPA